MPSQQPIQGVFDFDRSRIWRIGDEIVLGTLGNGIKAR